jgi:hypothetical protein
MVNLANQFVKDSKVPKISRTNSDAYWLPDF